MPKGKVGFDKNDPNAGGQFGKPSNFTKNKSWRETLLRAILAKKGAPLRKIAEALIRKAEKGDVQAIKEVGDRIDGKAVQQVEVKASGTLKITTVDAKL